MKIPMFRAARSATALALFLIGFAASAAAQQINAPEDTDQGVIQEIDFAHSQMVVSGYSYDVTATAKVEINGTYGAFTMLSKGMRIEFHYKKFADGARQIYEIRELADGEEMDEA